MEHFRIAVLITCYNRKQFTVKCIERLFTVFNCIDIYLVDDNSSDGTSLEIQQKFPEVNLIKGSGNLYWNRGMHLAWEHAAKSDYDFYLWINDDVYIYDNCFKELMECANKSNCNSIITGVIESPEKKIIYGGENKSGIINPMGLMRDAKHMNGNVVLIPRKVFNVLGNLDIHFHHDLGDVDYGLRAFENNIRVYTTRYIVGCCEENKISRVRTFNLSVFDRFHKLYSPLGSNPNIAFYFNKQHYGYIVAIIHYIYIHFINMLSDNLFRFFFKNKYKNNCWMN